MLTIHINAYCAHGLYKGHLFEKYYLFQSNKIYYLNKIYFCFAKIRKAFQACSVETKLVTRIVQKYATKHKNAACSRLILLKSVAPF